LGLTEKYCLAVVPTLEAKKSVWDMIFTAEVDKLSLNQVKEITHGFRQYS